MPSRNRPEADIDAKAKRGFIFLDSLIALALAGAVLAGLLTASHSLRQAQARAAHAQAVRHQGQNLLDSIGSLLPLRTGETHGRDAATAVRWSIRISPHTRSEALTLYAVTVRAEWDGPPPTAAITLSSLRIASHDTKTPED